jgi:hypothetical protein
MIPAFRTNSLPIQFYLSLIFDFILNTEYHGGLHGVTQSYYLSIIPCILRVLRG